MSSQVGLYESLGVDPECSAGELTAAFRKLALMYHPDKNPGQEDKFREISRAYKILSDYESRKIYDVAGEKALNNRYEGGDSFSNAHYSWADVEGLFRHHVVRRRGQDIREDLEVTLEDLYCGTTKSVTLMKYILCAQCKVNIRDCYDCNGSGLIGIYGCDSCQKLGYVDANETKSCALCKGERVVSKMTTYKINIRPGMYGGQYIPFVSEGNEEPGWDPGDRVFILKAKEHPTFDRVNVQDLTTEVVITSRQKHQPGGCVVKIKTLDGRTLDIPLNQGIRNGTVVEVPDEGLPDFFVPTKKGKLIITVRKVKTAPEPSIPINVHDSKVKRSNSLGRYFFQNKSSRTPRQETNPDDCKPARTLENDSSPAKWSPTAANSSRGPKVKRTSSFGPFGVLQMRTNTPEKTTEREVRRQNSFSPFGVLQIRTRASGRTRNQDFRKSCPPASPTSWYSNDVQPQNAPLSNAKPQKSQSPPSSGPSNSTNFNSQVPQPSLIPPESKPFSPPPQPYVQTSPLADEIKPKLVVSSHLEEKSPVRKTSDQWKDNKEQTQRSAEPEVAIWSRAETQSQTFTASPSIVTHLSEDESSEKQKNIEPDDSFPLPQPPEAISATTLPSPSPYLVHQESTIPEPTEVISLVPANRQGAELPNFCPIDFSENDATISIDSRDYEFASINEKATIRAEERSLASKRTPVKKRNSFKLSFRKKKTPPRPTSDSEVVLKEHKESRLSSTPKKRISHGPITSFFLFRK